MSEFKLYESHDGLVQTKIYGMGQDAFVVTEDKMDSFNNYSFDFQAILALFSTSLGVTLGSLTDTNGTIFIVSSIITVLLGLALWRTGFKFSKTRKSLFLKSTDLLQARLKIISAIYGTEEKHIDLTSKLNELVVDNKLNFSVNNNLAGDPHPHVIKTLKIKFILKGENYYKEYKEGQEVSL